DLVPPTSQLEAEVDVLPTPEEAGGETAGPLEGLATDEQAGGGRGWRGKIRARPLQLLPIACVRHRHEPGGAGELDSAVLQDVAATALGGMLAAVQQGGPGCCGPTALQAGDQLLQPPR